jgi:hypothetical protein
MRDLQQVAALYFPDIFYLSCGPYECISSSASQYTLSLFCKLFKDTGIKYYGPFGKAVMHHLLDLVICKLAASFCLNLGSKQKDISGGQVWI